MLGHVQSICVVRTGSKTKDVNTIDAKRVTIVVLEYKLVEGKVGI